MGLRPGSSTGMRIALATLAAALLLAAPAAAQTDTTPTIAADGRGTATLVPDIADFRAGVVRRAPTSAAARRSTNARIAAVLKVVKARGVADADVQTTGLEIVRERVGRRGHRRIRYVAAQELLIRVRDVKNLGAMLDAVANAGADAVEAPDFGFADPSQGRLLATRAALADARKRAEDAAAQTGLRITGVRTVDVDPQTEPEFEGDSASGVSGGAKRAPGTTVEPGTQEFEARVRVIYTATPAT
jgi:uncharacterized protein